MYHSIVGSIASHADTQPDRLALADSSQSVTYEELWRRVYGLSLELSKHGVGRRTCVVVECNQSVDYMTCEFAIQLLKGIFVPVEKNSAPDRIREILDSVEAVLDIGKKSLSGDVPFFPLDEASKYAFSGAIDPDSVDFPCSEDTSEILFSTGTTGKSKGIELTHGNDAALAENVICGVKMKKENVELIPMPLSHSHGLRRTYGNLVNGSAAVFIEGVTLLKKVFNMMDEYNVTAMDLSPSSLSIIFKLSKDRLGDYADQLDYIQLGSAPLPEEDKLHLSRLLPNTRLYNFYGSTEAGCSGLLDFNSMSGKPGCIGKPAVNAQFIVVDENRNTIDSSEENLGCLASSGPINMKGYWKEPELTAKTMADGYIYTKDLGYIDEDGFIYMLGRKDDVINYGGIKISPEEIESIVIKYPLITDCACIPVKDPLTGQAPKLFIALSDPDAYEPKDLKNFLAQNLDASKLPKYIEVIEEIPRTFNGKIQRKKLIERAES